VTGLLTAIPYTVGVIGLILWGHSSDRHKERRWHLIIASSTAALGLAGTAYLTGSAWALVAMSVAAVGLYGSRPSFWPMPSLFLSGAAAAVGIALINSIGNLGGFLGPSLVGAIVQRTGNYSVALFTIAVSLVVACVVVIALKLITPATPARAV
jgi:ACS family tartrate transporter-like MFS transporter